MVWTAPECISENLESNISSSVPQLGGRERKLTNLKKGEGRETTTEIHMIPLRFDGSLCLDV